MHTTDGESRLEERKPHAGKGFGDFLAYNFLLMS
jgi:hypothetical protein